MIDRIAKQKFNVILLVDCSTSMRGTRINQVNSALNDIKNKLCELQAENANVDFYVTLIPFSTEASFANGNRVLNIEDLTSVNLKAGGWSNLHLGLAKLEDILEKESKGGIMPDFGGVAPLILLLTDGHPTGTDYKNELDILNKMPWFKASLRYGIAIELNDARTIKVLNDFVGDNGDVISCDESDKLKNIIKLVVITASKVKSQTNSVTIQPDENKVVKSNPKQEITKALDEIEEWEW